MTSDRETILAVDDMSMNLDILVGLLKDQYRVKVARSGERALHMAREREPPDLILLDIMMPGMDGFEVCRRLKADAALTDVPVIFVSALTETMDKVKAFGVGAVDYLTKPFHGEEVLARVSTHLELHRLRRELAEHNRELESRVKQQVEEIAAGQFATIFALSKLAESRDDDTGQHLERVRTFCRLLATRLREHRARGGCIDDAFIENISRASPLHDIGKVAIPDSILLKPGRLTADEFEFMKTHTLHGARTLEAVHAQYPGNTFVQMGIEIARSHHEKWNGKGYPDGLQGEQIPVSARIMALADVYDALRSERCYKSAFPHRESCAIIVDDSGEHFDPELVAAFQALESEFEAIRDEMDG